MRKERLIAKYGNFIIDECQNEGGIVIQIECIKEKVGATDGFELTECPEMKL